MNVAPMTAGPGKEALRFFVQTDGLPAGPAGETTIDGYLVRNGMPPQLMQVFRDAGLRVGEPSYMLFKSLDAMRQPYVKAARDLALIGLVVLLLAGVEHYWKRKLSAAIDRRQSLPTD
jgi:hypothetical protein